MSLNIKSDEAHRLARDLSELTGETMTAEVIHALRERRAKLVGSAATPLSERLLVIGRTAAAESRDAGGPAMAVEDLYDDRGLPR